MGCTMVVTHGAFEGLKVVFRPYQNYLLVALSLSYRISEQ